MRYEDFDICWATCGFCSEVDAATCKAIQTGYSLGLTAFALMNKSEVGEALEDDKMRKDLFNSIELTYKLLGHDSDKGASPVRCIECKYLDAESGGYATCAKAWKGIVNPDDCCGHGIRGNNK